jgi:hypothetical protein
MFSRFYELRHARVDECRVEAMRGMESIKSVGWLKNWIIEWLVWFYLRSFQKGKDKAWAVDVAKIEL